MTAIERTAYRRFTRPPNIKELQTLYTPTPPDVAFVLTTARGPAQTFALMILLKVFQKLGLFSSTSRDSRSHRQPYSVGHETQRRRGS